MKKVLKVLGTLLLVLIMLLILIPFLFKDKIKELIIQEFAKRTTATLYFSDVTLSAFRNFPDLDFGIEDFGIVGTDLFEGDTLISSNSFHTRVGLRELIFNDEVVVKSINLDQPSITLITLIDGHVNYDIMRPSDEIEEEETSSDPAATLNIDLEGITVSDGQFIYFDQSSNILLDLEQINLTNMATYVNNTIELKTSGKIGDIEFIFDDISFISQKSLGVDLKLIGDLEKSSYRFDQNEFLINELPLTVDGTFEMLQDGYGMNISFDSPNGTLEHILSLVPAIYNDSFEKLIAEGEIGFNGGITGEYSDEQMPSFNVQINIKDGNFSYTHVPAKIEDLQVGLSLFSEGGELSKSRLDLSKLDFMLEGNTFHSQLEVVNFESPKWKGSSSGAIDLTSFSQVMPSSYKLEGLLNTDIETAGDMALVEAEKYDELKVDGQLSMQGFSFISTDLPHQLTIEKLDAQFSPRSIQLNQLNGQVASTAFNGKGSLQDFIAYALNGETLKGDLTVEMDQLIMSEWLMEVEADESVNDEVQQSTPVRIPDNISFQMVTKLGQVDYDGLKLQNVNADVKLANGELIINRSGFEAAEGRFNASGRYDSKPERPKFDMDIKVASVSIPGSFQEFTAVQKFAPIAAQMSGNVGFDFNLEGVLGQDMMPDYSSLTGAGLIQVIQAGFENSGLTEQLSSTLRIAKIDNPVLNRLRMQADIIDGRLFIKPFETKLGDYQTTIGGSTGIDGSLDYELFVTVPAKGLTQQVNNLAQQFNVGQLINGSDYVFDVALTGTFNDPAFKVKNVFTKEGTSTKEIVAKKVEAEIEAKKEEIKAEADAKLSQAKDSLNATINQKMAEGEAQLDSLIASKSDSLTKEMLEKLGSEKAKDSVVVEIKDKAKSAIEGLLKRKKKNNR